jgi:hypothetical protein
VLRIECAASWGVTTKLSKFHINDMLPQWILGASVRESGTSDAIQLRAC